jgi:hypothetical protein
MILDQITVVYIKVPKEQSFLFGDNLSVRPLIKLL